jgi:predicted phage tail protein
MPWCGYKGGDSTPHAATEAPNSLHSTALARIVDVVSEGQILGFAHGTAGCLQDIYLDGTPVANADGSLNFKNVVIDSRLGTQTQSAMAGFPSVQNEIGVGLELKSTAPWVQAINDLTLTSLRIRLGIPSLSKDDTTTGDIVGYRIDYAIDLATDGGAYVTKITSSFDGHATGEYERAHTISLPTATSGWTVRVRRLTANANLATIADTTTIQSYTEIVDSVYRYPNTALIGIVIDAEQFSSIPTRAYDLYGRVIKVPTNYNPLTRVYTGVWDGTFKIAWTDNPAWVFYDLILNTRYGLGNYVTASQVNKWGLYTIAQYCDGLVPDGNGGMEPRFTCAVYLQQQASAYQVLSDLASVFRGIAYWAGGVINASADMPTDPTMVYSDANVVNGEFNYQGTSKDTRYTAALVSYIDDNDFGQQKVEYVEYPDQKVIDRYGIQETQVTAMWCKSQGQARRFGLWILYTSVLDSELVTFGAGLDTAPVMPGHVAKILDSARAGKRRAGRVVSATTTSVVVDAIQ